VDALPGDSALRLRGPAPLALPHPFLIASFIYPLICALIIYVQHNVSALGLLGVQGANRLISINVTFFMSLLGWQSMLALFLAAFIGPGQVSPDLANNALSLYLARPFSRRRVRVGQDLRAGDPDVADDLGAGPAAVRAPGLPGRLELDAGQRAPGLRPLLRRVDLDLVLSLLALALSAWVKWKPVAGA
jgi:ABC-2 type transport system permease protein